MLLKRLFSQAQKLPTSIEWNVVEPYITPADNDARGATTLQERAFCEYYGAKLYSGRGKIVELGPWLGSLTARYCQGLEQSRLSASKKQNAAEVYDLFRWESYMEEWVAGSSHAGKLEADSNFQSYFEAYHQQYAPYINVHTQDLEDFSWSGEPVEFLLNDAVKTPRIGQSVLQALAPSLIPEQSLVAHQDYLWCTDSYIQVFMYLLRDYFAPVLAVPNSAMVVFRTLSEIPESAVKKLPGSFKEMSPTLVQETFAWSRSLLPSVHRNYLDLGEACVLSYAGELEKAQQIVQDRKLKDPTGERLYDFMVKTSTDWGVPCLA